MAVFKDLDDINRYIGEMFRLAADHPTVGPKFRAANITMRVIYADPDCEMTVRFVEDMETIPGPNDHDPDVTLSMRGDTADAFWQGNYNLAVGLAKGEVKAKGPVNKILKLVPLTKPLFPVYREIIADRASA
jgi:putative sterol carrier protein